MATSVTSHRQLHRRIFRIPWLFSLGVFVAFGVPAFGQSFNALPLSVTVTVPVGQGNAVTGLADQHLLSAICAARWRDSNLQDIG